MSQVSLTEKKIEDLRRVGKSAEADKFQKRFQELAEEVDKASSDFVIEIDMGPDHKFAGQGFHREKPVRFIGKTKFKVVRVVEAGQPAVKGDKMLEIAARAGCDTTLEEGERIAAFFNSPAGRDAYKSIQDAGLYYIILPHKDGIWVDGSASDRCVPVLNCGGGRCVSRRRYLGVGFGSGDCFLVPCE